MKDFGDRFMKVKETIRETISDRVSYDVLYKAGNIVAREAVNSRIVNIVDTFIRKRSDIIPRDIILRMYYKLYFGDGKFNMRRFKLLSSSERLYVTEKVLEEL